MTVLAWKHPALSRTQTREPGPRDRNREPERIKQKDRKEMEKKAKSKDRIPFLATIRGKRLVDYIIFMGPAVIMFTMLFIIPLISELVYSFTDWNGVNPSYNFLGLKNYQRAIQDETYWVSMWFTIKFSFCVVVASNLLAFFWAYLLSRPIPLRNLWRAIIYVPRIIGGVILGYLWRFIFQEAFVQFGKATGLRWFAQQWFTTTESSFWALVIVMTWTLSGYLMIIYGAGFSAVPHDFYEAAAIDGATRRQQMFKITIPMLRSTITRCLFIAINWAMLLYDTNISLTSGNPYRSSEGVTMNIYQTAFRSRQIAYGSAKSMIFVAILVLIAFTQMYLTSRKEVEL